MRQRSFVAMALVSTAMVFVPVQNVSAENVPDAAPPPEQDTTSATGVSLVTGGYSTSANDLSIGQGEFPNSLTLTREYSSSLNKLHGFWTDGIQGWGWSTNLSMYITIGELGAGDYVDDEPVPTNQRYPWRYGVSVGTGSLASFVEQDPISDPIIGPNYEGPFSTWDNVTPGQFGRVGDDLVYVSEDGIRHLFEGGSRQTFRDNDPTFRTRLEAPDGTILLFHGDRGKKAVTSNRGLAILFEFASDGFTWTKACAVNLAIDYATGTSNCPSKVPSVTYQHAPYSPTVGTSLFTSATNQLGQTTTYEYTSEGQLDCIKAPGQAACQVRNYYSNCLPIPNQPADFSMNAGQQVYRQDLITGETIRYDFDMERYCPLRPPGLGFGYSAPYSDDVTMTYSDGSTKTVRATYDGIPLKITDELGRVTDMVHGHYNLQNRPTRLIEVEAPEGNKWKYQYSGTQISKTTIVSKDGSSQQVWETEFGPCKQPSAKIDANGNRTEMVYDTTHCGILKKTLPADDNGFRPETRYAWGQKYAWLKNSGNGYSRANDPVWVLLSEEYCRTSAADANGNCAAGSADKVVTTYEYQAGSASKGSNVFQIGLAVTADGQTLRTCYGLDYFGRQISETQPKAGLTSCQ